MKPYKINTNRFLAIAALFAFLGQMFAFNVSAQIAPRSKSEEKQTTKQLPYQAKSKISPDMEDFVNQLNYGFRADEMQKVIITLESNFDLDAMAKNTVARTGILASRKSFPTD